MVEPLPHSFETLRDKLAALAVPAGEARQLVWLVPYRLGTAITANGAYEIFLLGPPLTASASLVANNLVHDRWEPSAGGPAFEASRILLGSAPHFAAMAALIAIELARLDVTTDAATQKAFSEVEPIIELAIRRAALSDEAILGVVGELQVLRVALLATTGLQRATTLLGWRGWAPGRDFLLGKNGIEVKATVGETSRHAFSGIHQLEPQEIGDGEKETLHLLSLGFERVELGGSSLPELVDDLLSLLSDGSDVQTAEQAQLLSMVANYGGASSPSYEHGAMHNWSIYQQRYAINFARLYDIEDPEMRLLTRGLVEQTFAIPDSLTFELTLPALISAFNPAGDWQSEVARFI